MRRSLSAIVMIVLGFLIILLFWVERPSGNRPPDLPSGGSSDLPAPRAESADTEGAAGSKTGTREVVGPVESPRREDPIPPGKRGAGSMDAIQEGRLLEGYRGSAASHQAAAEAVESMPSEEVDLHVLVKQAHHVFLSDLYRNAAELVAMGQYQFQREGWAPPPPPANTHSIESGAYYLDGERGTVHVHVPLERIWQSLQRERELQKAIEEQFVGSFNALDFAARKRRWEAHLATLEELWRRRKMQFGSRDDAAANAMVIERLERELISPSLYLIDLGTYLLRRRN